MFVIEDKKANMDIAQTEIPARLRQMVDLLVDEEARMDENTTGVCMEFFLRNGVLSVLVNISESDSPFGIRGETIRTMASMIDLLNNHFLVHNAVHKPTVKLLRSCVLDERQSEMYHEDLVDLMYIICSKIHGFKPLLNIFFHDKQWLTTPQKAYHSQNASVAVVQAPSSRPAPIPETPEETAADAEAGAGASAEVAVVGAEAGVEAAVEGSAALVAAIAAAAADEMEIEETTTTTVTATTTTTTAEDETVETVNNMEIAETAEPTEPTEPSTPSSATPRPTLADAVVAAQPYYSPQPKKPEYEFLLFTYLLRFVHREGRSGDYARTGLLFIMEMANEQGLGDFILDSDFATIMVASLGALYSQLPRKLVVKDEMELNSNSSAYLLGFDMDPRALPRGVGVEMSSSPDFKYQLDSFLKLLEFCQDVLTRCPNVEISFSLLQNIRTIFLENILYPSILECSDVDGSSVAVISYIDLILQTLQQDELVDVVVGFLMVSDDDEPAPTPAPTPRTERQAIFSGENRRQSNIYVGLVEDQIKSSPYFTAIGRFTLKDLIFTRLKSSSQPTVVATLKLLHTLITRHCRYSLQLLSIEVDEKATNFPRRPPAPMQPGIMSAPIGRDSDPILSASSSSSTSSKSTTISHHLRELELFFSLISAIDESHSQEILSVGYETYLRDAEATIEADWCYQNAALVEWSMAAIDASSSTKPNGRNKRMSKMEKRKSFKYGQRFDEINSSSFEEAFQSPTIPNTPVPLPSPKVHIPRHRVRQTDPLLQILLGLLSHFFAQSSELNLALTGVISALAVCPYRSLEGWLAFRESDRADPDELLVLENMGNTGGSTPGEGHAVRPSIPAPVRENANKGKIRANDIYAHFEPDRDPVNENDDNDDRSIDFATDRNSVTMTAATTFKSFPPFFTLFRTLTQQVDYYRSEINLFDLFLQERRKGLFQGEAALADPRPSLSASLSTSNRRNKTPAAQAPGSGAAKPEPTNSSSIGVHPSRRPSALRASTSASPRLGPVRSNSMGTSNLASTASAASSSASFVGVPTPSSSASLREIPVLSPQSPLSIHAHKTREIRIQPLFPSNFVMEPEEQIFSLDEDDEDTFAPKTTPSMPRRMDKSTEISLSNLLNNVVILEEAIKELVALVQVRRSLGIDEVLFA
ncbi:Retinoic acid induced 16-like protein-domain-containing protein [Jimgerdemannia flammicorona]|uniref:Retinoic acid induced 16-like protein-domain-containing protein n=1 Tax=Jimgerdemannia flammicorona TaxID=994334 RepID=A0A433DHD3_9FUNG|nr:Retinoic acid induced 16-like protein-domain-containing protein [Jimgerdemannia flammicorona]